MDNIIGHRGASAYAPENTIKSFQVAKDLGCRCVEFDVSQSVDKKLFVFHDDSLERTTNGTGDIAHVSFEYLKSLDAGSWFGKEFLGVKIPTLDEALAWLIKNDMHANIEIKATRDALEITKEVLKSINYYWSRDRELPVVSSFDYSALLFCYETNPNLPLGLLFDILPDDWLQLAKQINCDSININQKIVTKKLVDNILDNGFKVYVYTVNNVDLAKKILNWGVSAIFSDYPDLLNL